MQPVGQVFAEPVGTDDLDRVGEVLQSIWCRQATRDLQLPGPLGIWYTTDLLQELGRAVDIGWLRDDELEVKIEEDDETVTRVLHVVK